MSGREREALLEGRGCCLSCGAHVIGNVGIATIGARCSTCGSFAVIPLELYERMERMVEQQPADRRVADRREIAEPVHH